MKSGPSQPSNIYITCSTVESRALCAVCGAPAIGRNFDAYTCLSCKAFFRRNAYNEHLRYTCRLRNDCEIIITTRRHCSACRLNKCFQQGMKKELIRSLAAINQASSAMLVTQYHSEQAIQRRTTMDLTPVNDPSILSTADWSIFTNIRNYYENFCIAPFLASHERIPLSITTQPYRSRLKPQRLIDLTEKYLSILIYFVRQVLRNHPNIGIHYQFIRENFSTLLTINTSELMRSQILQELPWENDRFLFESVLTESLLQRLEKHLHILRTFLPYDSLVIKLFLIILGFNACVTPLRRKEFYSPDHFQPFPLAFVSVQNYYVTLLWKYVIYRFGYTDAVMFFARFIQHFLRRQIIQADAIDIVENREDQGQLLRMFENLVHKL